MIDLFKFKFSSRHAASFSSSYVKELLILLEMISVVTGTSHCETDLEMYFIFRSTARAFFKLRLEYQNREAA